VRDLEGRLGRSAARNKGLDDNPADWHFLLDADDEMAPGAFSLVDLETPATFGAVRLHPRTNQTAPNYWPVTREFLFLRGAEGTLSMGCFVRGNLGLRFDESLDFGEDFDFYMRLPGFTKQREPLAYIGYDRPSASGPRQAIENKWVERSNQVIAQYRPSSFIRMVRTGIGNYYAPDDPGEIGYAGTPKRRSITDSEAEILAHLAKGCAVLEIGTGLAVSTRALASTAQSVVTVDPDPWISDPQLAGVVFLREAPIGSQFDLAFIDGNHAVASVLTDLIQCRAIPVIVLHDTNLPGVIDALARLPGLIPEEIFDTPCRLAVYRWIQ
jgi:hypothetical protein